MNNFNKNIIDKIKKGELKQEAKLSISIKKYLLWLAFMINTLISGFTFTFFLRTITDSFGKMHELKVANSFFLSNIFWIWLLTFMFFITTSILNFKQTQNGWRYENYKIILFSIIISLLFGLLFYTFKIDNMAKKHFHDQEQSSYIYIGK